MQSVTLKVSFLFVQTLHNECSPIEVLCAHFTTSFSFLRGVEFRHVSLQSAESAYFV